MFKTILVASDLSEASTAAITCGRELARKLDANMHLVHVVADPSGLPWTAEAFAVPLTELVAGWQEQARHDLLQLLPLEERAGTTIGTPLGMPDVEIIRYAMGHHVELIVMGTHGRGGLQHFVLGSVAERVARKAPCAVLIARQPAAT